MAFNKENGNMTNFKRGDKVLFGRDHGEKTLGEVLKVNAKSVKVKQLESRGTFRAYKIGTVWRVPLTLCSSVDGEKASFRVGGPMTDPTCPADVLALVRGEHFSHFRLHRWCGVDQILFYNRNEVSPSGVVLAGTCFDTPEMLRAARGAL